MRRTLFSRRIANVGSPNSIYSVEAVTPDGANVKMKHKKLLFKQRIKA
jgi:hypothetical protein